VNKCPNGHRFPDGLPECPVCARDNELKTMYAGSAANVSSVRSSAPSPIPPLSIPTHESSPAHESDLSKTVILGARSSGSKGNLVGWLILIDLEGLPTNSYQLFNRRMAIGRARTNDIVLSDDAISGSHCSIEVQNGKFVINDNGAANKTIVDTIPVTSCILEEHATIQLGRSHFKIKYAC